MAFPGESAYRAERLGLLDTLESLTDEELDGAPTLCEGWAPRDVAAHLLGVDNELGEYVRARGNLHKAHAAMVEKARRFDRPALMARMRTWATSPALISRTASALLLGDLAIHHQDILRGLGRSRVIPLASRDAILREGAFLGAPKLLRYRVVPDDGGRAIGRGREVRGSSEALGLWLAGRRSVADDLEFA